MLFSHKIISLWTAAPHFMPSHVLIDHFSSHEKKNETDFCKIFEILKLLRVFELEGIETSEIHEAESQNNSKASNVENRRNRM
jgi:hypothetical protein